MTDTEQLTREKPAYREVELDLRVSRRESAAEGAIALGLADPDGGELPEWTPDAHIDLVMGEGLTVRWRRRRASTSSARAFRTFAARVNAT